MRECVLPPPVDEDNVHCIALQELGRRLVCLVHGNDGGSISQQNAMMAAVVRMMMTPVMTMAAAVAVMMPLTAMAVATAMARMMVMDTSNNVDPVLVAMTLVTTVAAVAATKLVMTVALAVVMTMPLTAMAMATAMARMVAMDTSNIGVADLNIVGGTAILMPSPKMVSASKHMPSMVSGIA